MYHSTFGPDPGATYDRKSVEADLVVELCDDCGGEYVAMDLSEQDNGRLLCDRCSRPRHNEDDERGNK
jgi:hypothetical protein